MIVKKKYHSNGNTQLNIFFYTFDLIASFTVKQIVPSRNSSFIVKDTNRIEIMVETIEPHFFRCSVCKSNEYKCIHGAAVGVYVITYMENEYKE